MSIFSNLSRLGAQRAAQEAIEKHEAKIKSIEDSGIIKFKDTFSEAESLLIDHLHDWTDSKKYKVFNKIPNDNQEKQILYQMILLSKNPQTIDVLSKDTLISVNGTITTVMGKNPTAGECFILGTNAIYCFSRLMPRTLPILLQDFNGFEIHKGMIYTTETKHDKDKDNVFFYPNLGKQSNEHLHELVSMLNQIYNK